MSLDREEFDAAMQRLEAGITGIHSRLDQLNGRTRDNEVEIAKLATRVNVYVAIGGVVLTLAMPVLTFVLARWGR